MGVFAKLKNIFYDDVEEEPVIKIEPKSESKKEVKDKTEEIKLPDEIRKVKDEVVEEVKTDNTFSERDLFRSERTFNFTEFDDEDDPTPQRKTVLDLERRTARIDSEKPVSVETPKVFRPSPVISPIYGILDKDYTKDSIEEKKNSIKTVTPEKVDYDTVRRKAYGTLEDQLEDTMIKTPKDVKKSVNNIESEMDKLNEKTAKIEDLISRIENTNDNMTIEEAEEKAKEGEFEDTEEIGSLDSDDDKTVSDDTLEHDLFNLIDSMYDDKEE